MWNKELLTDILSQSLKKGGDWSEIFGQKNYNVSLRLEDKKIEEQSLGLEEGAGLRVVKGDKVFYGYTTNLTKDGLLSLAKEVAEAVGMGDSQKMVVLADKKQLSHCPEAVSLRELKIEDLINLLREMDEIGRSYDPRIVQVTASLGLLEQSIVVANTKGLFKEEPRVRVTLRALTTAEKDGVLETGLAYKAALSGAEFFKQDHNVEVANLSAKRAIINLEAQEAPSGEMPVIIDSRAGGTMVHEAVGHGLEGDLIVRGMSIYKDRVGQQVASPLITLIDDGTLAGHYGSSAMDDEGTPTQRNVLIDKGVLTGYMHTLTTAEKMGVSPTGNGRRQNFRFRPVVRMTNTYIDQGPHEYSAIINSVDKGIIIYQLGGGQVDTTSGDFVFAILEGYLLEKGKIGPAVKGATLIGNGPKVLEEVEMLGNDSGFTVGTCGKDGQGAPVTDGTPTMLIKKITIGGKG